MKKLILFISIFLSLKAASACDICGCGVGGNYIGILPEFSKHIAGMRYRYNYLQTHIGPNGQQTYLTTKERFYISELWAAWSINTKWRVMANVPFSILTKSSTAEKSSSSGIGDPSVSIYHQVLNKRLGVANSKIMVHSLWLGAGIKLPFGKYNPANVEDNSSQVFQLGTGSTDIIINGMYDLRVQDIGVNIAGLYKFNTNNKYDFKYGNKWNINAQVYYKFRLKNKLGIAPNLGILYEHSAKDSDQKQKQDISGGTITMGTFGVELLYKKMAAGANFQIPIQQNLASGTVKSGNRQMFHIAYIF